MKRKIITLISFLIFIINIFSLNISDTIFDQRIDKQIGYKEIIFKNKYNDNIRYKITVLKAKKTDNDMSSWVKVSPRILNISPKSEKVLKIFAKSPQGAKNGTYVFYLKITPIVIPTIKKSENSQIRGGSSVYFLPIIKMYGYVGNPDFKKNIKLKNIRLTKINKKYILKATLLNESYAGKNIGFNFIGNNNVILGGRWVGRIPPNFKQDIEVKVNYRFEEISIYDAETYDEIKRVVIKNGK